MPEFISKLLLYEALALAALGTPSRVHTHTDMCGDCGSDPSIEPAIIVASLHHGLVIDGSALTAPAHVPTPGEGWAFKAPSSTPRMRAVQASLSEAGVSGFSVHETRDQVVVRSLRHGTRVQVQDWGESTTLVAVGADLCEPGRNATYLSEARPALEPFAPTAGLILGIQKKGGSIEESGLATAGFGFAVSERAIASSHARLTSKSRKRDSCLVPADMLIDLVRAKRPALLPATDADWPISLTRERSELNERVVVCRHRASEDALSVSMWQVPEPRSSFAFVPLPAVSAEAIETMRALASCLDECDLSEIGVIVKASCLGRCQKAFPPLLRPVNATV